MEQSNTLLKQSLHIFFPGPLIYQVLSAALTVLYRDGPKGNLSDLESRDPSPGNLSAKPRMLAGIKMDFMPLDSSNII